MTMPFSMTALVHTLYQRERRISGRMVRIRILLVGAFILTGSTVQVLIRTHAPAERIHHDDAPRIKNTVEQSDAPEVQRGKGVSLLNSSSFLSMNRVGNKQESRDMGRALAPQRTEHQQSSSASNSTSQTFSKVDTMAAAQVEALSTTTTTVPTNFHPLDKLKVPHPIFVASLPKSGTTSTSYYFNCGKIWNAHTFCNTESNATGIRAQMRVGHCYQVNVHAGRPPFEGCGRYKVWSDGGHPMGTPCFYPSVHGLDAFYNAYPNATIMLVTRNSTAWASSVQRWKDGSLLKRWKKCAKPFPHADSTLHEIQLFYEWHMQHIRQFVASHPSLTFVDVALEDERIGELLEDAIGLSADCFGHHNNHAKRAKKKKSRRKRLSGRTRAST